MKRFPLKLYIIFSLVIISTASCAVVPSSLRVVLNRRSVEFQGAPETVAQVENRTIPGPRGEIPLRIYTPDGAGPFPMIMYFHGGGFVLGNLDTCNNACHFLSKTVGCIVIAVDYRLAPEHKFPAGVEDAYTATAWAAEHAEEINGDASRLAVVGESAGGNLAAATCIMAQDRGGPPLVFQVMAFASTNLDTLETDSYRKYATGYGLTKFYSTWLRNQYIGDKKDRKSPYASPLLAKNVRGVPPALVLTGEFDVLRDDGELYVEKLKEEGVPARLIRYADKGHMAHWMTPAGEAGDAQHQVAFALKAVFRRNPGKLGNNCENCP